MHLARVFAIVVALGAAGVEAAAPVDESPPTELRRETYLGLKGRWVAGAGHVVVAPVVYTAPGVSTELGAKWWVTPRFSFGSELSLTGGAGEDGQTKIAGYSLMGEVEYAWIDARRFVLSSELHAGVDSVALVPIPRTGFTHEAALYFVRTQGFSWNLALHATTDLLVIAPALGAGLTTSLRWQGESWFFRLELTGRGDLLILGIANFASATASAMFTGGYAF